MKLRKWHHFISRCHKRKWLIYSYHFPCNSKWPHIKKWCQYTRLWHDWSYYVICDQVALTSLVIVSSMFLARFKSKNFPVYIEVLAPHLLLYCFNNVSFCQHSKMLLFFLLWGWWPSDNNIIGSSYQDVLVSSIAPISFFLLVSHLLRPLLQRELQWVVTE